MSIIRKKPYIESKLEALATSELQALVECLNNATPVNTQASFKDAPTGVKAVQFTFKHNDIRTGIIVNKDFFLAFDTKYQALDIIELDFAHDSYKQVDEYLSIEELRRVANDLLTCAFAVGDVKALTSAECERLKCGNIVIKRDDSGEHAYLVTYKKDKVGICLTYMDATYVETISYDYREGEWVYNSMDTASLS